MVHVVYCSSEHMETASLVKERIDREELKEPRKMLGVVMILSGTLCSQKTTFFQNYMQRLA
jgi:tRNA A37 threonylcarbamoyladenosine biosynthesis protein TsaE